MYNEKAALRRQYLQKRNAIPAEQRVLYAQKINVRIATLWAFRDAETVLGYYPIGSEADILPILREALRCGRRVALPVCSPETRVMRFYAVKSLEDLPVGAHHIPAPAPDSSNLIQTFQKAFCIVPGLAFTSQGFRMGYGGGYYDRFLARFDGVSAGCCYADFLDLPVPVGRFDRQVQMIVTPKHVFVI
ncbi:MAG: 5-formyltetrahydrofolate cyclo-ligase [Oscillospiraceae bacterium]|jgi:5-formyltetrahydrofolate cyclo-ligase|nr:5-formyltetrahydrofolate cyclo-ligase [Oscillospiraceae bacterium]